MAMSAVGAPPIKSLSLGPPRSSHLPLLTSCSTATAATSDGRTVHIQSSSSLLSYRLPSRAILISFVHDHLLAVTTTGDVFKLPISPADGKKRARESPRRAAILNTGPAARPAQPPQPPARPGPIPVAPFPDF